MIVFARVQGNQPTIQHIQNCLTKMVPNMAFLGDAIYLPTFTSLDKGTWLSKIVGNVDSGSFYKMGQTPVSFSFFSNKQYNWEVIPSYSNVCLHQLQMYKTQKAHFENTPNLVPFIGVTNAYGPSPQPGPHIGLQHTIFIIQGSSRTSQVIIFNWHQHAST